MSSGLRVVEDGPEDDVAEAPFQAAQGFLVALSLNPYRFRSSSAFASFAGVAPIEVSSGDLERHRLSRAGDRQLNYALRVMAITRSNVIAKAAAGEPT